MASLHRASTAVVVLVASSSVLSIVLASSSTLTTHPPRSLKFYHTLPGKPPHLDPFGDFVAGASPPDLRRTRRRPRRPAGGIASAGCICPLFPRRNAVRTLS